MYKFDEINYYTDKLDVEEVIKEIDVNEIDEAVHICDLAVLVEKYKTWQKCLPRIEPYYAVKCNDDDFVLNTLVDLGLRFDCDSKKEIKQMLDKGVSPDRIIYAHTVRPISHIKYAKEQKIPNGSVDNEFEIYKIFKYYPQLDLLVRFRCDDKDAQSPLGAKFGCDAETEAAALLLLANSLQLNVVGVSFHVGSGCNDISVYGRAITIAKDIFSFGEVLDFEMKMLDIGGGFPGDDDDKFANISKIVNETLNKYFSDDTTKIIAEPGRYFVYSAFTLICKINGMRDLRIAGKFDTKMYYLNDGVYGSLSCVLNDTQEILSPSVLQKNKNEEFAKFKTLLWGPSMDEQDKIIDKLYFPYLSYGDVIIFKNMGAYGVGLCSPFSGFMIPKRIYFMRI